MSTLMIDESKSNGYVVVAAVILPTDAEALRKEVNRLRKKGQRRIHFTNESDRQRRLILSAFSNQGVTAMAYRAHARRDGDARAAALRAVVADIPALGADRLVLEQDDSLIDSDKRLLFAELRNTGQPAVAYRHERAVNEPLLAIPDALAWCIQRGGEWLRRADPMLQAIRELPA